YVGRGTVSLAEPETSDEKAVRSDVQVARQNRLSTDSDSQGYLAFSDPYSGEVIATVLLRSDSQITLDSAARPRFSLSENPYTIRLTGANGRLEVWVRSGLDREVRLDIEGALGDTRIGDPGTFMITTTPSDLTVSARQGSATLVSHNSHTQHIAEGTFAALSAGDTAIQVGPGPIDLLPNSTFVRAKDSEWPVDWSCAYYPSPAYPNAPPGQYRFITQDGRPTIHIQRLNLNPREPGEMGCEQFPADRERGLDVRQYDSLRLRVIMLVHHQSLSACGVAGSECPVMLYVKYRDRDGNPREWWHGFYAEYTPNQGRTRCDTCLEEHERINKDAWYTYESGNLFTDLPEGQRPGWIIEVKFYASGHEFDVMLNEVSLLATLPAGADTAAAP
ncbi:MAG: hypothetical protein JW910_14810, partial [Anaerolineae bacterium]|nr:hypothetical protein [Anaerolineae bacterium]